MKAEDPSEITSFPDYKSFIRAKISEQRAVRGYQNRLSLAAGCTPSFLSQVVNSSVHLTPDHAAGLVSFWNLSELDGDYFLALIHEARAASAALRLMIQRSKNAIREKKFNLAKRFKAERLKKTESEFLYYSGWQWAAIHVLLSIPQYRTLSTLSARLGMPTELITEYILQLEKMGLVKRQGNQWRTVEHNIHLPKHSPVGPLHHLHWRQRANENFRKTKTEAIHYTAIHGLSVADADRIRHLVLKLIEESRAIVGPSKEEEAVCFACDFFTV